MPLPVSAATYIHNPLVGVQAAQAGTQVGLQNSPFANFLTGAVSGFERGVNIAGKLQEIELQPEKLEIEKRRTEIQENRLDLDEQRFDFEQTYKTELNDIRRESNQIRKDAIDNRVRRAQLTSSITAQKQARQNVVEGSVQTLIDTGNPEPFLSLHRDPAARQVYLPEIRKYFNRPENAEIGSAAIEKLENLPFERNMSQREYDELQSLVRHYSFSNKITSNLEMQERVNKPVFKNTLGPVPELDKKIEWDRNEDVKGAGRQLFTVEAGGTKRERFAIIPRTIDPRDEQALWMAINSHNFMAEQRLRINKEIREPVEQAAALRAQQQQIPTQQDVPVNVSREATQRTPQQRVGLQNAPAVDEGQAIRETEEEARKQQLTPEEASRRERARQRIRKLANENFVTDDERQRLELRPGLESFSGAPDG